MIIRNIYNYQWEFTFQGKKDNLLNDFLGGFKSFLYLKTKEGVEIPIGNGLMNIVMPELTIKKDENVYIGKDIVASNYILTYTKAVSYTHLRAHETGRNLVCRLLLEKKKKKRNKKKKQIK